MCLQGLTRIVAACLIRDTSILQKMNVNSGPAVHAFLVKMNGKSHACVKIGCKFFCKIEENHSRKTMVLMFSQKRLLYLSHAAFMPWSDIWEVVPVSDMYFFWLASKLITSCVGTYPAQGVQLVLSCPVSGTRYVGNVLVSHPPHHSDLPSPPHSRCS